jgi:2Fe-2S ferredoxin
MPKITYIEPNGNEVVVDLAECGGSCSCATCHCYVESHADQLTPPSEAEDNMLANVAAERRPNSRLSCQIKATADMDGMVVRLPAQQS